MSGGAPRAMVLCAGLGTRLRPLTATWPKPAMPLLGRPLFDYALATLRRAGVTQVGINTHHLPQVMEATARAACQAAGVSLTVSHEAGEIQGTGGGIRGLRDFLSTGVSVVLNGDVLFALDLEPVLAAHRSSGAAATMVLLPMPAGATYNAVETDAAGRVRRIAGQGPGGERLVPWHFSGVHVLSPEVFGFMAQEGPEDINRDVYLRMLAAGKEVHGHVVADRAVTWSDLGTPQTYLQTHQQVLFGQVSGAPFGEVWPLTAAHQRPGLPPSWAHPSARLGDARISGPAYFAAGAVLEPGVRIGAAVSVGKNAHVGAGAHLNRVAVLDGARVPAGVLLEDALVGPPDVVVKG